ncbi:MAG: helix-turn-helix transcriptional regulator [Clostridia bacterium]|nr:helix-turn-helix transcriptional regulator [Clostridia bacterium]
MSNKNIAGAKLKQLRQNISPRFTQRVLAEQLQLMGIDVGKNQVQEIESGKRKISDIELKALANIFHITADALLEEDTE